MISFHTDGSVQERGYQLFFSHVPVGKYNDKVIPEIFQCFNHYKHTLINTYKSLLLPKFSAFKELPITKKSVVKKGEIPKMSTR